MMAPVKSFQSKGTVTSTAQKQKGNCANHTQPKLTESLHLNNSLNYFS